MCVFDASAILSERQAGQRGRVWAWISEEVAVGTKRFEKNSEDRAGQFADNIIQRHPGLTETEYNVVLQLWKQATGN